MDGKGKRLNPFEHALARPDTYIGSNKTSTTDIWVLDPDTNLAVKREIRFNPGLFQIIREILSNSIDNVWRSKENGISMKKIHFTVDPISGMITVCNDGYPIPIEQASYEYTDPKTGKILTETAYPPEVFFGDMFSGTNYDDTISRKTSGRNGMGAKATNVFSTIFKVECTNPNDGKKFEQTYTNNGKVRTKPKIIKYSQKAGYTSISFTPDYKYFGFPYEENPGITQDFIDLLKLYAYEVSMITSLPVTFFTGDEKTIIKVASLERYAKLFFSDLKSRMISLKSPSGDECVLIESQEEDSNDVSQTSFVNGIQTRLGGVHVKTWRDIIINMIVNLFNSSKSATSENIIITAKKVYPYLHFFIRTEVDRPAFESQSKNELIQVMGEDGKPAKYSLFLTNKTDERKEWIDNKLTPEIKKVMKWDFIADILIRMKFELDRKISRKEGTSTSRLNLGPNVDDANKAGKKHAKLCTAYITEGLSAKSFVIRGISVLPDGRDYNGAMAIKGKFTNVAKASKKTISENNEINQIKKFLGLQGGLDYKDEKNFATLRYGKVVILTDADDDGIHIRGLLLNFFYVEYPSLIERNYVESFSTAVVVAIMKSASVKKKKGDDDYLRFFSNPDFKKWYEEYLKEGKKNIKDIKYYKGLGTITKQDTPNYFKNPKLVSYYLDGHDKEFMSLGFVLDRADSRKEWITTGKSSNDMEPLFEDEETPEEEDEIRLIPDFVYEGRLSLSDFVKDQLIIYSRMSLRRSLPCVWDGLKESQRKSLYTMFFKNYKKSYDLEKIMGAVKEITSYHHGGAALTNTIVKMAQNYVGSNNIPLFVEDGGFGCVDPETKILLWNGKVKLAVDITVDDILIGDDGEPRKISKIVSGNDMMYSVKSSSDTYIINSKHILTLRYVKHLIPKRKEGKWYFRSYNDLPNEGKKFFKRTFYFSTPEEEEEAKNKLQEKMKAIPKENVFDISLQDYLSLSEPTKRSLRRVYNSSPIQWKETQVELDPYILGLWFGGGEVKNEYLKEYSKVGNLKKIPENYLINGEGVRLDFLSGFIEGCGEVLNGTYKFPECRKVIRLQIQFIARSLGYECEYVEGNLYISGEKLWKLRPQSIEKRIMEDVKCKKSSKIEIEPLGRGKYVGWYLDRNERFLLGDFTVTHNTRELGGEDHAAPRYIESRALGIARVIFHPDDDQLLERIVDDGDPVEYRTYMPIIPLILINGVAGIATGFSSTIPAFNPLDIVRWIESWLDGKHEELERLIPWYRGFTGVIKLTKNQKGEVDGWISKGKMEKIIEVEKRGNKKVQVEKWHITELPIETWTTHFKGWLEYLAEGTPPPGEKWKETKEKFITNIKAYHKPNKVHFVFEALKGFEPSVKNKFKNLEKRKKFTNMVALDENDVPKRYESAEEILLAFCNKRFHYYTLRRERVLENLKYDYMKASNRFRFIKAHKDRKIDLHKTRDELDDLLGSEEWKFDRIIFGNSTEPTFDYLLNMAVVSISVEKLKELENEMKITEKKMKELQGKTEKDLWNEDLGNFKVAYEEYLENVVD